ncbi:peptidoglycan-binding protein LysM [Xanthovirga aplysinae]|uniref:peptidoglycan-binding protein LysM n=1 Tax=Xanthovirga aplysinae TaxID=2529853 RepID=UPI0012BC1416|nr:peptidoglycan-binding protein LysM [Xanthovirga aplysinae]MTI33348.1 peptidoglycan-binding protein LysM [Xanthovirga aplysinae]
MGIISFLKNAGDRILRKADQKSEDRKTKKINKHIRSLGLRSSDITSTVIGDKVVLSGVVENEEERDKLVVAVGNVQGIAQVDEDLKILHPKWNTPEEKQFYTVQRGDSLSKIAEKVYGDANKYPFIFEANKPMLTHPDKIYPGQVLIIPPKEISGGKAA